MKLKYVKGANNSFVIPFVKEINSDLQQPLLTKFIFPKPQNGSLVRNDLIKRLDAAMDKKMIIISAPAGYGKTNLLSDWLSTKGSGCRIAWISLDSSDNDIVQFWMDILHSIISTGFLSADELHMIINDIKHSQIEKALIQLINKVLASIEQLIIIIEDYHHICRSTVLNSLSYFIERMPHNIHLVFTGRIQFPLPVARMQLSDQTFEIGVEELRLSQEELAEYLSSIFEFKVSPEFVTAFDLVTEGWIAAVKAIAMQMKKDSIEDLTNRKPEEFIHCVFQYIKEEIVAYLPVRIHPFLAKTSVLHTLQESLCNKIVDIRNSGEILEFLENNGLLTLSTNSERTIFRYHYIFCRYWRRELESMMDQDIEEWYRHSIKLFEEEGAIESALYLAMHAKLFRLLGELLVKHIEHIFSNLGVWKLSVYFKSIPDDILKSNPILCIYYVIDLMMTRRIFDGEAYMSQMGIPLSDAVYDKYILHKTFIFTQSAIIKRDYKTIARYSRILKKVACGTVIGYAMDTYISRFYLVLGYSHKAEVILEKVLEAAKTTQNTEYLCVVTWDYAILKMFQGEINAGFFMASNLIKKLHLEKIPKKETYQLPKLGLSLLSYEANDIERAHAYFQKSNNIQDDEMEQSTVSLRPFVLARIFLAQNKRFKALKVLHENDLNYIFEDTCLSSRFIHDIARVCIALEEKGWIRKIKQYITDCSNGFRKLFITESIALADIFIYEGNAVEALEVLHRLPTIKSSVKLLDMKINILKALAYRCQGRNTEALECIRHAVILSGQHGFVRSFIDYGEAAKELLLELQSTKQQVEKAISEEDGFILKLLSHFRDGMEVVSQEGKLLNTLSSREAEVLRYICLGYSNKRIAEFSYVSVSLVKKIKTSIFQKLGVANMAEAIILVNKLNTQQCWEIAPE